MKKSLLIIGGFSILLFATNPSLSAHRGAALEKMMKSRFDTAEGANFAAGIAVEFLARDSKKTILQRVSRQNYGLFSLTRENMVDYPNPTTGEVSSQTVGIGILGHVYLWGDAFTQP